MGKRVTIIFIIIFGYYLQNYARQPDLIDSLKKILAQCHDSLKYSTCELLADELFYADSLLESAFYYELSAQIELNKKRPDTLRIIKSYDNVGYCYYDLEQYYKALEWYTKALNLAMQINDSSSIANVSSNIGCTYHLLGNYAESLTFFEKALKIDLALKTQENVGNDYNNLGKVFESWGKYHDAITFYKQALGIAYGLNDLPRIAIRLSNIGSAYMMLNQNDSALYYIQGAYRVDSALNNHQGLIARLDKIGIVYQQMANYNKAGHFFQKAIEKLQLYPNPRQESLVLKNLGYNYFLTNQFQLAEQCYLKSLAMAQSINLLQTVAVVNKLLSELYEKTGDYKKALYHYAQHVLYNDSVFTSESQKTLNEFHVLYQTEKKENEIKFLNQQKQIQDLQIKQIKQRSYYLLFIAILLLVLIVIITRQFAQNKKMNKILAIKNKNLDELNATKDRFFAIIAHDLKNPVNAFTQITRALNENVETLPVADVKYFIEGLNQSAHNISGMLNNLLHWAKIQRNTVTPEKAWFNLYQTVNNAVQLLSTASKLKNIALQNQINQQAMVFANEQAVFTIVSNLITNAIKFSAGGKTITIGQMDTPGGAVVFVDDQGIGMTEMELLKLFRLDVDTKTIGQSAEKGTGLGLIICKELVETMGGNIWAESQPGKGSRFLFNLPA
jgi:signal transduction histidine kinase